MTDELFHYGTLRKSGRYPWGSGDNPQRNKKFLDYVQDLRRNGLSEAEIATGLNISTTQLRAMKAIAKNEERAAAQVLANSLRDSGMSNVAIGEQLGINESSVRSLLKGSEDANTSILNTTASMLKDQVSSKQYIDVGVGVENHLGISGTKLSTVVEMLKEEGYTLHYVKVEQLGTGKFTSMKVLAGPDVPYSEVFNNQSKIRQISEYSEDGGRSFLGIEKPRAIAPDRVGIKYGPDGGASADGVIYLRPGVDEISLGGSRYAQVRIAVGDGHYLKGMAMYKDDLPDGVDVLFNTNKNDTGNKLDALKGMKDDPDNPFGSVVRQRHYTDKNGKRKLSAINIVNDESDWDDWSRNLASQLLSKQSPALAKQQLAQKVASKQKEFDEILSLTNPTVKKQLLETFADDLDSSSVHLKAAALPRQKTHVILPFDKIKDDEIYAPNYRNGEKVALVRYPHGGTFEIPELTVNNKVPSAIKALGSATSAVGINAKVAQRLSGADFDGDTVIVIPNNDKKIRTSKPLAGLKDFDPQTAYPAYEGMPRMSPRTKQTEMGKASNLITDMTIRGANQNEIARAVRHSMVVIDAEKHNLNYKQSAIDNGIAALKEKYQGGPRAGASTLISRASSEIRIAERKPRSAVNGGPVDPATGKRMYEDTKVTYLDQRGKTVTRTIKSTKMAEAEDAHTLSSGTPMEKIYAEHANKLKSMANQARKTALMEKPRPYSPSAKVAYAPQVTALNSKLNVALMNAPRERQAQLLANSIVAAKRQSNPGMEASDLKKIKGLALQEARNRTNARKIRIVPTPDEWAAIQAGAISNNKLTQILSNADSEAIKSLATPRTSSSLSPGVLAKAKRLQANNYTQAEIADALGISTSLLNSALKEAKG